MFAGVRAWATAAAVIVIWGVTFVNTRALLGEFSALEILVGRFALGCAPAGGVARTQVRCCHHLDGTISLVMNKPEKGMGPKIVFTNNPKIRKSR